MSKSKTAVAVIAAPVAVAFLAACQGEQAADETTSPTTSPTSDAETITTDLQTADGRTVANAKIEFANGTATITLETTEAGLLSPGFHGFHIHEFGRCEANSVAPTGGEPGDFLSAGGHLHMRDQSGHPAVGDLTPVEVHADGSARLVATTDSFTIEDLRGPEGSALMLHERPDNFANIPPRYTVNGVPGPDAETLATGDAGSRVACGVLAPASAQATTPETTETTTITETTAPVPPATGTSPATTSPAPAETTSPTETETPTTTTPTTTTSLETSPSLPEEEGEPEG
ncbi:superoxide dismutase[Cu-Zn] [Mycolicibacterium sp. XJ1819]